MAIIVKERKKGVNWFSLVVTAFFLIVIIGGGYLLFFTTTPGIEVVAPSVLRSTSEIAGIQLDSSSVLNHPKLKGLKQYGGLPSVGSVGRPNPLIGF
jgi:hypothetical protein